MQDTMPVAGIEIFSTCPPFGGGDKEMYVQSVIETAHWSDWAGCKGVLVYTDNSQLDPWLVSQIIIQNTASLSPLVAVQPVYMHPYTVAKMVASLGYLYGRRVYLNMVAGGFKNDLTALNDTTPHDKRYQRLLEYTTIIKQLLLADGCPISYEGDFYKVEKLKLTPPLPEHLFPGVFMSGSSEAGEAAARAIGATAIKYPKPASEEAPAANDSLESGIRVGIIAREDESAAWEIAHSRFPEDRRGQITHQLAIKVSDSVWHKQLSEMGEETQNSPYWLVPFQNYKTMCPYLVGSYERVAEELSGYIAVGYRTFVLDVPPSPEELKHINVVFARASQVARWRNSCKVG